MDTTLPPIYQRHLRERKAIMYTASKPEWSALISGQRQESLEYRKTRIAKAQMRYRREHPTDAFIDDFLDYLLTAILKTLLGMVVGLGLIGLIFWLVG